MRPFTPGPRVHATKQLVAFALGDPVANVRRLFEAGAVDRISGLDSRQLVIKNMAIRRQIHYLSKHFFHDQYVDMIASQLLPYSSSPRSTFPDTCVLQQDYVLKTNIKHHLPCLIQSHDARRTPFVTFLELEELAQARASAQSVDAHMTRLFPCFPIL